jgi:hypothetical protein
MFDGTDADPPSGANQPEPGHPVAGEDTGAPAGGAGRAKEKATERIGDDAEKGQTATPAPDDDVGVPSDVDGPKD